MITRYRSVVAPEHVEAALRAIWHDLMRRGILPDEIDNYRRTSEWFPWLKTNPAIERLRDSLNRGFGRGRFSTDPQIVFQPPDRCDGPLEPHVDRDGEGETFACGRYCIDAANAAQWWSVVVGQGRRRPLLAGGRSRRRSCDGRRSATCEWSECLRHAANRRLLPRNAVVIVHRAVPFFSSVCDKGQRPTLNHE